MQTLVFQITFLCLLCLPIGCSAPPAGRVVGEACAVTADCQSDLVCRSGTCAAPTATCPAATPVDCGSTLPGLCCPQSNPVCCARDKRCHATQAECRGPTCGSTGTQCATSATCCTGFVCYRYAELCGEAKNLAIGDTCTADAQCASRSCSSYCTRTCTANSQCGPGNFCLDTADGPLCIPSCGSSAECSVFGAGVTCAESTDPTGATQRGCFGT